MRKVDSSQVHLANGNTEDTEAKKKRGLEVWLNQECLLAQYYQKVKEEEEEQQLQQQQSTLGPPDEKVFGAFGSSVLSTGFFLVTYRPKCT
jgi:hypothetical protein